MVLGTVLLGLAALMLYGGFTGNSPIGEIQKLLSGSAAFGRSESPLLEAIRNREQPANPDARIPDDLGEAGLAPKGGGGGNPGRVPPEIVQGRPS